MENSTSASRKEKRWSLSGTSALVTGGTKGIGHAIVEELAGFGATVHTCSRTQADLKKCLQEWENLKFKVTGSVCDVSSQAEREKLMEKVSSIFHGKLNILICNAGTGFSKPTVDCTTKDYSFLMATNLESAFHLSQLSHPMLKASGNGSIVYISSLAGLVAFHELALYSVTKGAINQLTKNLACEWAKDNIRANCIAPGLVRTPLVQPRIHLNQGRQLEIEEKETGLMGDRETKSGISREKRWSLLGFTDLVTGGSIGIGVGRLGARVHTCCQSEEDLKRCLHEWKRFNFDVTCSVSDVSSRSERKKLIESLFLICREA